MNHRERNPLLESDRLDPSMYMYLLFARLLVRVPDGLFCPAESGCEWMSGYVYESGHKMRGHEIRGSTRTRDRTVIGSLCDVYHPRPWL